MREIKFRGLTENTRKMVYGSLVCYPSGHYSIEDHLRGVDNIVHVYNVVPETIGQFTGLRDKNGTEIFEGDVVKFSNWASAHKCEKCGHEKSTEAYGFVKFSNSKSYDQYPSRSVAVYVVEMLGKCSIDETDLDDSEELEVIGNIHENPELLK